MFSQIRDRCITKNVEYLRIDNLNLVESFTKVVCHVECPICDGNFFYFLSIFYLLLPVLQISI